MSQKKVNTSKIKNTVNELDNALEQWNSLTNNPAGVQVKGPSEPQKRAKEILEKLKEQLDEFSEEQPN